MNRAFHDKPHGMIVDYIGIGEELREATARYTQVGDPAKPAADIEATARPLILECLEEVRMLLPAGQPYGNWRRLSGIEHEDLCALVYGTLTDEDALRDHFLEAEGRLSVAFLLVKHLTDCRAHADGIIFYQRVRNQLLKTLPGRGCHMRSSMPYAIWSTTASRRTGSSTSSRWRESTGPTCRSSTMRSCRPGSTSRWRTCA